MRYVWVGLWFATALAIGAEPADPETQAAESPEMTEEAADAEILEIEKGVSGADEVEEFVPKKPLSADKAIALPSDI